MSYPTLRVDIAFTSTPLDTTPTWVDVTSYVRDAPPVTITRGRSSNLTTFSAGMCSVTLNNRTRRFDPTYSTGPYFGNLKPGKQIRLTAVWLGVDYELFTGWIIGWPQAFEGRGKDATVTVQAHDAIGWMAKNRLPSDLVYEYADGLGNLEMFLRRTDDFYWLDETGNGHHSHLAYGVRSSGSSMLVGTSSPSVSFNGLTVFEVDDPPASAGGPWSLSFVMNTTSKDVCVLGSQIKPDFGSSYGSSIVITDDGFLRWAGRASTLDVASSTTTTRIINDGNPHHIVITGDGSGADTGVFIYVDGVAWPVERSTPSPAYGDLTVGFIGDTAANADDPPPITGSLQDVAFWSQELTSDEITGLYSYTRGYYEEDMATRIERLLDEAGWPATWRDISTSCRAICGELALGGSKVLEKMQQLERTEQGRLFAAKNGDITFRQRYFIQEETRGNTVQVIFSDDGAAGSVQYSTFGFDLNSWDIQNDITVTAAQVGQGRSVDLTSVNDHGPEEESIDTVLTSTNFCTSMATGLVWQRKDPLYRSDPIVVPQVPDALWDNVLNLELGDRIQGEITPLKVGSQIVQEMTLEQIGWTISKVWEFVALGAPVPPAFFVVGVSEVGSPDVIGY